MVVTSRQYHKPTQSSDTGKKKLMTAWLNMSKTGALPRSAPDGKTSKSAAINA